MRFTYTALALLFGTLAFADSITMKNGDVIRGTYLGGTARQVRFDDGTNIQTVDVGDIRRIEFSNGVPQSESRADRSDRSDSRPILRRPPQQDAPVLMRPDPVADSRPSEPQPAAQAPFTLPAGTNLVIRMIEAVDSQTNRVGQTFRASMDEPVLLDGREVIPRGADAMVKLVDSKESGKLTGRAELALSLQSVSVNGRMVDINTQTVNQESSSRGERTAKVAGGTAAVGAIIGAIAGGGKGAAIGAGAGAAAGAGAEMATKGQRVRVPSETRLTFVLDSAVNM